MISSIVSYLFVAINEVAGDVVIAVESVLSAYSASSL
jgi:hypothetical protein